MHDFRQNDLLYHWTSTFVSELYTLGLRHVVISPGSRSTPLTLALSQHSGIQKHVVLDERSAAFIALGIGMKSGVPAALVCTSGTAVANYFPAVIESGASGIPMLVLSADRPPIERNVGANQAMDQQFLFGNKAVFFADAGEPRTDESDFARLRTLADQAWYTAVESGGTSHVNFPFRKPLEPGSDTLSQLPAFFSESMLRGAFIESGLSTTQELFSADLLKEIEAAEKPLVICGPSGGQHNLNSAISWLASLGIPVLLEAGASFRHSDSIDPSHSSFILGFNSFLRLKELRESLKPDLILRFGAFPTGKAAGDFLATHKNVRTICFEFDKKWTHASLGNYKRVVVARKTPVTLPEKPVSTKISETWVNRWKSLSQSYNESVVRASEDFSGLRDGDVWMTISAHISPQTELMVSNSFPVRDIDQFAPELILNRNIYMNRGVSGIDGITSTAVGIAKVSESPLLLVTGDLAFLHDITSLLSLQKPDSARLTILVINNGGGGIFRMLPVYNNSDWYETYFGTPQNADIPTICKGFGIPCRQVATPGELRSALEQSTSGTCRVIECLTDAEASMLQRKTLWENSAWKSL